MRADLNFDRLPIRVKLTLAFSGAMAVMFAAIGIAIYFHFKAGLDNGLNSGLKTRVGDLSALVRQRDTADLSPSHPLIDRTESFAQILDLQGRVVESSPRLANRPLLSLHEIESTADRPLTVQRGEQSRLMARRIKSAPLVVVAGVSLEQRERAMETLAGGLLIGGPLALLLASLAGYAVAARALATVDAMRMRADEMSASNPGRRLPLPAAHDEIYRLGETLNRVFWRMDRALEHERAFVADASHELRTPLTIMKAEIEVALRGNTAPDGLRAALVSAGEETDRLAQLAEDLLILARGDEGALPVRLEQVSARELFERIAERFVARADRAGASIAVEAPTSLDVTADATRVEQALANFVENALRYGAGEVLLRAVERDGGVELHVLDHGRGFDPAFLPRAFDRFSRGQRSGPGAGLGLAITAAIAQAHGGEVGARNRADGSGADVWLSLPMHGVAP